MRYMPRLRSPVSGSRVTTHGSVMKRPPSSGQHFRMGRLAKVGPASRLPNERAVLKGDAKLSIAPSVLGRRDACPTLRISGAAGQASLRDGGASYLWMTSLHEPLFTVLGLAWRKSSASDSSLMASLKLVGGLAFISAPSSLATSSTDSAPMLMAMRLCEPSVLMATGNGETTPLTVGFSNSSALPPPGSFISRSAFAVISSSVATGWEMRLSSPALSRALTKSRKESKAIMQVVAYLSFLWCSIYRCDAVRS